MPRVVVAGSENEFHFAVIDFTNPAVPSVQLVTPAGFTGGCLAPGVRLKTGSAAMFCRMYQRRWCHRDPWVARGSG
jgi:hypothetical protein